VCSNILYVYHDLLFVIIFTNNSCNYDGFILSFGINMRIVYKRPKLSAFSKRKYKAYRWDSNYLMRLSKFRRGFECEFRGKIDVNLDAEYTWI
jgi:hypothetical protein